MVGKKTLNFVQQQRKKDDEEKSTTTDIQNNFSLAFCMVPSLELVLFVVAIHERRIGKITNRNGTFIHLVENILARLTFCQIYPITADLFGKEPWFVAGVMFTLPGCVFQAILVKLLSYL